ncbi:MAG: hypothetical protein Q7T51_00465 [Candidatus Moranbacteria bacterium]|nr:hypothetical protein [Candidatus Moranbacteria bacterium]
MRDKFQEYNELFFQKYLWRTIVFVVSFTTILVIFANQFASNKSGWLVSFALCTAFVVSFSAGILDVDCYQCKRATKFVWRRRKKIKTIAIGYTIRKTIDWFFDNPLYIFVIAQKGPFIGGVVMMLLSAASYLVEIIFYNWSKKDWFGFSVVNELRDNGHEWIRRAKSVHIRTRWIRIIVQSVIRIPAIFFSFVIWLLKRGDVAVFFTLSIMQDPFVTVTYMRRGSFEKFSRKDWYIFWGSVIISNLYWTLRNVIVLKVIIMVYKTIFK